jgi:hypothetical protein
MFILLWSNMPFAIYILKIFRPPPPISSLIYIVVSSCMSLYNCSSEAKVDSVTLLLHTLIDIIVILGYVEATFHQSFFLCALLCCGVLIGKKRFLLKLNLLSTAPFRIREMLKKGIVFWLQYIVHKEN